MNKKQKANFLKYLEDNNIKISDIWELINILKAIDKMRKSQQFFNQILEVME